MDIKKHLRDHKTAYYCAATGIVVAGITTLIMRGNGIRGVPSVDGLRGGPSNTASKRISRATGVTAGRDIVVTRKSVLNNVSYISANRKGAPSWVIRCLETGLIFTSQRTAALEMGLSESHVSAHLNGVRNDVHGFHFERICLAA